MKTLIFINLILFSVLFDVHAQIAEIETSKTDTIRLDLKSARGAKVSELFEDVKFVPLETTKESTFGTISQLEVANDCYIIYDQDTRFILIFNLNGTFRTKMKSDNPGKGYLVEFKLIEDKNGSAIRVPNGNRFSYFDLNGKFLKSEPLNLLNEAKSGYQFAAADVQVKTNYDLKGKTFEVVLVKDGKETAAYFPHEKDYARHDQYLGKGKNFSYSGGLNEIFYKRYYDYGIYRISPEGVSLDYQLILPIECSLPADFSKNNAYKNKQIEYFENNRSVFYSVHNIFKVGDHLFFSMATLDLSKTNKRDFIFNLKSRNLLSLQDIEADALSSYLPITNLGLNPEFFFHGFYLYKNGYLYNSIPSIDMITLETQSPKQNVLYSKNLKNYFTTVNRNSNPVLVLLKPKKG